MMKTSELTGAALDWAVWNCTGGAAAYPKTTSGKAFLKLWKSNSAKYIHPSTDWSQGGPIIERERISIDRETLANEWLAATYTTRIARSGPTPLVAAMRTFVASKFGDEIEIPEELK